MIRFACPVCKTSMQSRDQDSGRKFACPSCGQRLQIPAPPPSNKTVLGQPLPASNKTILGHPGPEARLTHFPLTRPVIEVQHGYDNFDDEKRRHRQIRHEHQPNSHSGKKWLAVGGGVLVVFVVLVLALTLNRDGWNPDPSKGEIPTGRAENAAEQKSRSTVVTTSETPPTGWAENAAKQQFRLRTPRELIVGRWNLIAGKGCDILTFYQDGSGYAHIEGVVVRFSYYVTHTGLSGSTVTLRFQFNDFDPRMDVSLDFDVSFPTDDKMNMGFSISLDHSEYRRARW